MDDKKQHRSDCAVHNEPYSPAGPCNCGVEVPEHMTGEQFAWMQAVVTPKGLAQAMHESRLQPAMEPYNIMPVKPWDQLSLPARASLLIRARYLLEHFDIKPRAGLMPTPVGTIYGRLGP